MRIISALSLTLFVIGCGGNLSKSPKKAVGGEGQLCRADRTCNKTFVCVDNVCEVPSDNNENVAPNMTPNNMNVTPNNENVRPNSENVMTGFCGDGVWGPGEACDGTDLAGESCLTFGFEGGQLLCDPSCQFFDDSSCENEPTNICGNFIVEPPEVCDADDLRGESCESLGYTGGELRCGRDCFAFDVEGCSNAACGNGVVESGEFCDSSDVGGQTCAGLGYTAGDLRCNSACADYDVSLCTLCGNGVKEAGEDCDGDDFGGESCLSLGLDAGELACSNSCVVSIVGCGDAPPLMCGLPSGCSVNDVASCACLGCVDDGVCTADDDCVCPECQSSMMCPDSICIVDGICDPFNENCRCIDCAAHPECAP